MGIPNCMGESFFHDVVDDDEVEEDLVYGDVASFIGSQIMNARFPCASNPADPALHSISSVESFMRLSVAITTFPSPTVSSFFSV
uniref:Uncharacterized protein LOC105119531 n=1 Tax=Rhizophora mucronata TaxID=61149 RepID=A0A2P2QKU1_RHIMU